MAIVIAEGTAQSNLSRGQVSVEACGYFAMVSCPLVPIDCVRVGMLLTEQWRCRLFTVDQLCEIDTCEVSSNSSR